MRCEGKSFRLQLAVLLTILWGAALASGAAWAQEPPPQELPPAETPEPATRPPVEDFSKPMGPPDELNRGTPRGTMYGFLSAARAGDHERAARHLDLRRLPPEERERAPELARRLKVVLDQTLWIDLALLSDRNEGHADDGLPSWQDRLGEIRTEEGSTTLLLQRVPRAEDGVRIWKVSAASVDRVPELYAQFQPVWLEERLPAFFSENELFGISLWKWLALTLQLLAALALALMIANGTTRLAGLVFTRAHRSPDRRLVIHLRGPVRLFWTVVLFGLGHRLLGLSLGFLDTLRVLERLSLVVAGVWLFFRLIDLAALTLRVRAEERENPGLLPVLLPGARFAKISLVLVGLLGVLGTLGVNITAAVAGLGVGGIAVALAAQKTVENLFGGITLFADRPVRVGDFCRYGDAVGTVEEIGLRSTRIRTLDRTLVAIPNAEFSNLKLENFAERDRMRLWTMIGVRYETTPDQLRYLLTRLREILLAHPRITEDPARVRFVGFGACSLDIEVFAYSDTSDWSEFLAIREDVYLLFMNAVREAGTGFAFPSTTTYLGRDDGLDEEERLRAEQRVAEWRANSELPFPELPVERREGIWNTLDWPPPGSADAERR